MKPHPKAMAAAIVIASSLLIARPAGGAIVLMDFGNVNTYRGVSVPNPDGNGNTWNSVQTGLFYQDMRDKTNAPTTIDFEFTTPVGTDSYNGPAGDTSVGTPASNVPNTDIDSVALGILGVREAAFDYVTNASDTQPLRFVLQELNPALSYKLTFFGSHKYNTDNITRYSVYTDGSYTTLVTSVDLLAGVDGAHNRDKVATLNNLAPQLGSFLFLQVDGAGAGSGYLNSMSIESVPEPGVTMALAGGGSLLCAVGRRRRIG
jgi:hypothetical protein